MARQVYSLIANCSVLCVPSEHIVNILYNSFALSTQSDSEPISSLGSMHTDLCYHELAETVAVVALLKVEDCEICGDYSHFAHDCPYYPQPEKPQIESKEDQPLVLVKPPTLPCTFGKPYKGVELKERSQIFYTANTFVLDDPDVTDSFVLEVPNELPNLKEGMHSSSPEYVDAPFVVNISKGEGIA
ncbi:hypothetical protein Scep_006999 [Stephania cephalantha]|uniref:CCHC-type domain-containing protein n=1 Tax=Stephania cephalantha TaxID=152367 RepID=A0AAP0K980_9MAGN